MNATVIDQIGVLIGHSSMFKMGRIEEISEYRTTYVK